ncbi:Inner membrane protein YrbG [BD1-7 clade bacterium]|uniref:Inner membrane protein YrbG n=1 Tax=BD1-7 clade bacterium TaxID=2029982 RepID=A0A5S9PED2_9GAMM|nr:Inner membrane protein YrbG [BD1-7 clade bacterium]
MSLAITAIIFGLILLVWSADRFVEGAASTARHFNMPPLLIGMVIVGFGTSAPEMVVSALAAAGGNPGIALGNAFGSNITNIALILGLTAVLNPIRANSQVLHRELPILIAATALVCLLLSNGDVSRQDAVVLLVVFAMLMSWTIWQGLQKKADSLATQVDTELNASTLPIRAAITWLIVGLLVLIISSRLLVWGAVTIAHTLGISDLVIGLTVVAVGTSLPELAASIIAARKGEDDIALGNIIGSNLFNTLAVIGIAGAIHPMQIGPDVLYRDIPVMAALTVLLFTFCFGLRGQGRINRFEGSALLLCYLAYNTHLIRSSLMMSH